MAGRSLTQALRCGECALKTTARSTVCQRRAFTSTPSCQKNGAVPSFSETTSPELDDILSTFRTNVFLPAHLSKPHRDLTFGARHRKVLQEDPVKVDIAGEEFRIQHVDRTKDQPDTAKGLFQAVSAMKEKSDWDNLPILLEGLNIAGRKIKSHHLQKLVRKAGRAGRQDTIIECARRVSRTGFTLQDLDLVREVMWWIQYKASSDNWNAKSTQKALSLAEQVAVMLEDSRHSGDRVIKGYGDARVRPEVVGILLELAAAEAKHNRTTDADRRVKMYAERLVSIMKSDNDLSSALPTEEDWDAKNTWLRFVSAILHGMRCASEMVQDRTLRKELKSLSAVLGDKAAKEEALFSEKLPEGSTPLGLWSYNTLAGTKS